MSFSLLLLLLLLSLHACDARLLRNDTPKEVDQRSNSFKENEKLDRARVSSDAADQKKAYSLPNNGTRDFAIKGSERRATVDEAKGESSTKRSEGRVVWKVPQKKGGQPEAGFNLDYLPPKTHPPVHN